MVYQDFKDLAKGTASDKILRDKALKIAKNLKCNGYQRSLAFMVYNFFDKKSSDTGVAMLQNEQLLEEFCKPIFRKF